MDKIRVSKDEYIFACIWACRHCRPDATVLIAESGLVFFDPCPERLGTYCVETGRADVSTYSSSAELPSNQVLRRMDAAGAWAKISRQVADDYGVNIEWVD